MNLDNELYAALRRKEPPAGFTERVLMAVECAGHAGALTAAARPPHSTWRYAAAAALLLAVIGGGEAVRVVRAKQQMLTALHITSAKLRDARNHVHEISTR
jgi:hypothetical protein